MAAMICDVCSAPPDEIEWLPDTNIVEFTCINGHLNVKEAV